MLAARFRTYLILFLGIISTSWCLCQNTLDSLEQQLPLVSGKDSVVILNNLGSSHSSLERAEYYSVLALDKAREIKDSEGEIIALINVGNSSFGHNRIDSALFFLEKAVFIGEEIGFKRGLGNAHNALGNVYRKTGDFAQAIGHFKEALYIPEFTEKEESMSAALNNMGRALNSIGSYNEATEYLLKALEINRKNGFDRKATSNLIGLAQIRVDQQEEPMALEYLEQVRKLSSLKDNLSIQFDLFNMLGIVHRELGHYNEAVSYFEDAIELDKYHRQYPAVPMHNLADTYLTMGDKEKALKMALKSLEIKRSRNREMSSSFSLNLLADIYLELKMPNKSLEVSFQAMEIVKKMGAKSRERKTSLDLAQAFESKGNYKEALKWRVRYETLQDSLFTTQKASQQRAMLTLFETEKKQRQIELQNTRIENQEIKQRQQKTQLLILIVGILILLAFIAVVLWGFSNLKKVKARIQAQNLQLTQLNQTKDKFFGIIAHDLRSPLLGLQSVGDQISYFLKKNQPNKLAELSGHVENTTKRLTDLLDNLLNWALLQNGMIPYHPEKVNLKDVVDSIQALLRPIADMKNVRLESRITEESFVYADSKAVHTILRNIISNALKYTDAEGEVVVDVKNGNDQSIITINDTGTGISTEQLPKLFDLDKESVQGTKGEKGSGLGLILCKELVELNKGKIEVKSDLGKGSSFIFNLPRFSQAA